MLEADKITRRRQALQKSKGFIHETFHYFKNGHGNCSRRGVHGTGKRDSKQQADFRKDRIEAYNSYYQEYQDSPKNGNQISFSVRYYMIGKSPKTWQLPIYFPACTGSLKYGTGLGYKPLFCISN